MNNDLKSSKLTLKFVLLVLAGILFPVFVSTYFLRRAENIGAYSGLIFSVGMLLVLYAFAAIYFLANFLKGIKSIEKSATDLKFGKMSASGSTSHAGDLQPIIRTIAEVQQNIRHQVDFAEQIKTGNLTATYNSQADDDRLGQALLGIKENLIAIRHEEQQRKWAAEGLAKFVEILQSAKNLKTLSNDVIINLVRVINANQGAVFIVSEEEGEEILEMQACYAFDRSKHFMQRIAPGQGLVGQAYLERNTVYLKNIPEKFVRITSGLGEANPKYILIVPLKMNDQVVGIIEVASFNEFTEHVISFVEKIGESIAHAVSSFRVSENTKRLLDESKSQTEALRAQEEELRQNQEELQATQEAISRKYDALFKQLSELNYQSKFDQLKSITSTKKRNVEYYFDIIRNQILTFAENNMVVEAVKDFRSAFYQMDVDLSEEAAKYIHDRVVSYYTKEFLPKLNENVSLEMKLDDYVPTDTRTLTFQQLYIADNPHPTGSKSLLNDAHDGSAYSKIHASYHSVFRSFLEKFGYYDIFLIDARTGDMLYSVFKEIDFATNLFIGPYGKTNFGQVVKQAVDSTTKGFVKLIDFAPYDPSYHAPASFIATVVHDGDEKVGILVFQMPIHKINQILTGNNKWRDDGLGETGETFIVGDDFKLRSISRQLIEDLEGHLSVLKKLNYSDAIIQQIRKMQTSILTEEVKTAGIANALRGETGTSMEVDSVSEQLLSAYAPLNIPDVHWVIVSTMKETEASQRIKNLRDENI